MRRFGVRPGFIAERSMYFVVNPDSDLANRAFFIQRAAL
jgi:hypothetical protein